MATDRIVESVVANAAGNGWGAATRQSLLAMYGGTR
jgi:hypothetical protein